MRRLLLLLLLVLWTPCHASAGATVYSGWVNNQEGCWCGTQTGLVRPFKVVGKYSTLSHRQSGALMLKEWNRFATLFTVSTASTSVLGKPSNGVNELNILINSQDTQAIYGFSMQSNLYGRAVMISDVGFGGFNECKDFSPKDCDGFMETDVVLNKGFSSGWTGNWYEDGGGANPALIQATALHEIGHTLGLHHVFTLPAFGDSFSVMNYANDDAMKWVTRLDAKTVRSAYGSRVNQFTDVAIYPFIYGNSQYAETYGTLSSTTAAPGDTLAVNNWLIQNVGTTAASNVVVTFYLFPSGARQYPQPTDTVLGSATFATLAVNSEADQVSTPIKLPADVVPGQYYLGAIVTVNGSEDKPFAKGKPPGNNRWILGHKNRTLLTVTGVTPITNDLPVSSSVAQNAYNYYTINVPAGASKLSVTTNAPNDVDLYLKFNGTPTTTSFDCTSNTGSGNEGIIVPDTCPVALSAGTWYIGVFGYKASTYTLTATVATGGISVTSFQINNGADTTAARTVTLNNLATGGPTHYMASESASFSGATWKTYSATPAFTLSTGNSTKTVYFKVKNVNGVSSPVNDTITLSADMATLTSGTPLSGSVAFNSYQYYSISVPEGANRLTVATTNAPNDIDLYLTFNGTPTSTDYDCAAETASGNEDVVVPDSCAVTLSAGTWTIGVFGYEASTYTLSATVTTGGLGVTSFQINGGATSTSSQSVTLNNTATGSPTHYMASESSTFSGAVWKAYGTAPTFSLSAGNGVKTVYFMVKRLTGTSPAVSDTITLSASVPTDGELTSGEGVNDSVAYKATNYYTIEVPATATRLTVSTTNAPGDIDLYLRFNAPPSNTIHDCLADGLTGIETVTVPGTCSAALTPGTWHIGVFGYTGGTYTLTATVEQESGFHETFNWKPIKGSWSITNGSYYSSAGVSGATASFIYNDTFSDFDFSARLKRTSSDDTLASGLLIRASGTADSNTGLFPNGYQFLYSRNGYAAVWKAANGTWTEVQAPTLAGSILQGDNWNELGVTANGPDLTFTINNTVVWQGTDSTFVSGKVGISFDRDSASTGDQLLVDWTKLSVLSSSGGRVDLPDPGRPPGEKKIKSPGLRLLTP